MARTPPLLGPNHGNRTVKASSIRLSDVSAATTTDYAEIIVGDDAPSGGYGRAAGTTLVYLRKNATTQEMTVYVSYNGGTAWVLLAVQGDEDVVATVACANATGGATTALMTVALKRRNNTDAIASARQVLLVFNTAQYSDAAGPSNASLSLGTVTAGSIIATIVAGSIYLIETSAAGAFACTVTNTDDETVYLSVKTAVGGVSDVTKFCNVLASNSDSAAWSA